MDLNELISKAQACVDRQQWNDALEIYQQLIKSYPDQPDLHHLHALVLFELSNYSEALNIVKKAIAIGPVKAVYLQNQADTLCALGQHAESLPVYKEALQMEPNNIDVLLNLGNAYHMMGDTDSALECYKQILTIAPNTCKAIGNIGKIFYDQEDMDSALKYYNKAIELDPNYSEAQFNNAIALLAKGEYSKGWPAYEWRLKRKDAQQVYPHKLEGQRWDGSPFGGESLLIHCEQGHGDVIQFCRYLPMVKALGGKIILEIQASLAPLLKNLPSVDETAVFDPLKPPAIHYDRYIPIGSLPMLMKTTLDKIPTHIPYIKADEDKAAQWQNRLTTEGLHVGLVWSGSNVDPHRACRLSEWHTWWKSHNIQFYSLQKGHGSKQLTVLANNLPIEHLGNELNDFSDTAAVIANLDLIITVDTAVAHLAGAMGKPVWILLPVAPDWRWLRGRSDTPWYPTARLFRQTVRNDWSNVIIEVQNALNELTAGYDTGIVENTAIPVSNVDNDSHVQAQVLYNQGQRYIEAGEYLHAVKSLQQAITIRPKWADAFFELGRAYHCQESYNQAIDAYRTATRLVPDMKPAYSNLGLAYFQKGELEQAAHSYEQAIGLFSDLALIYNNLGVVREEQNNLEAASECYQNALRINPDYADALFNLGNIHLARREFDHALICYTHAVQSDPKHAKAYGNLGRTYHLIGLLDQANVCFNKALRLDPEFPEAHFNRAISKLLVGLWEEGWKEYEWRFECHDAKQYYPHQLYGERWQGENFKGQTLLVHSEQGIGDAIQFVRYLPMVKERGGRIIFEARASLLRLFQDLQGADELIELSADKPPSAHYHKHVPLASLPGIFKTTPNNVPCNIPYLKAEPAMLEKWRNRLPRNGINVGLVWGGSNTYKERSISLADMTPLAFVKGINWIGLQKGPAASQAQPEHLPYNFKVDNWGEEFNDFSDTAAAIECMDLVISIDTAVAHLAGALGKNVWILLPAIPDWRWLLERSQTPWYPTAHLFRQFREGGWRRIIAHMSAALEQWRKKY